MLRLLSRCIFSLAALLVLSSAVLSAQGGPPFLTDDPGTPANRHWEINTGWMGERGPGEGEYELPNLDMNYGLGDRIQLKYELPMAVSEQRPQPGVSEGPARAGHVMGGVGKSLAGVKWRFYERRSLAGNENEGEEVEPSFALSVYPQLWFDNPTNAAARGIVEPGKDFLLPLEASGRIGWLRWNAEAGYHFGNREMPQRWVRGLLLGRELGSRTEVYAEIYDCQDATRVGDDPKQRSTTLGLGGRQALNREKTLTLLLMGGTSFQKVTAENGQPSWIAYVGLQRLIGPKERKVK